jgi:hypothetical protein
MAIWYILRPFGIFPFWYFEPKKSGNPVTESLRPSFPMLFQDRLFVALGFFPAQKQ